MIAKVESSIEIIRDGDQLIMDPENQIIIINPDQIELKYFKSIESKKINLIKA